MELLQDSPRAIRNSVSLPQNGLPYPVMQPVGKEKKHIQDSKTVCNILVLPVKKLFGLHSRPYPHVFGAWGATEEIQKETPFASKTNALDRQWTKQMFKSNSRQTSCNSLLIFIVWMILVTQSLLVLACYCVCFIDVVVFLIVFLVFSSILSHSQMMIFPKSKDTSQTSPGNHNSATPSQCDEIFLQKLRSCSQHHNATHSENELEHLSHEVPTYQATVFFQVVVLFYM